MVPMGVGEDEIEVILFFFGQLIAESTNARPGIDDNDVTTRSSNFKAGRVATVF